MKAAIRVNPEHSSIVLEWRQKRIRGKKPKATELDADGRIIGELH